jgi:putative Flp pilus-assembly TadE/G-like protein
MSRRLRSDSGQALVVTVVFMLCLLGGVALTLDVGSWYREHRQAQTTADAAALAAAQFLPNQDTAKSTAQDYATKNGGGIDAVNGITFSGSLLPNDTVTIHITRTAPGFFSKLFSIDSASVHAHAAARAGVPFDARWVAPISVNKLHPKLAGAGCPCFGPSNQTTLPLGKTGAPGAFALVNLDDSVNGTIGASTLGEWISKGFNAYLPLGDYLSDPGAKWNDGPIQDALSLRFDTDLLFPVYDTLTGSGSNAEYHVIGWVGFHLLTDDAGGSVSGGGVSGSITGYFTQVIWDGIQSTGGSSGPDYGVRSIELVN